MSQVRRGEPGPKGETGETGVAGQDGVSPVVAVMDIAGGHRITITDVEHPDGQTIDVMDGESSVTIQENSFIEGKAIYISNGKIADPSNSPTFCYCKVPCAVGDIIYITGNGGSNARLWIIVDAEGNVLRNADIYTFGDNLELRVSDLSAAFVVVNASLSYVHSVSRKTNASMAISELVGMKKVQDVQVNGVSVRDAQGVANIPMASANTLGVVLSGSVFVSGTTPIIIAQSGIQYICGEVATLDIILPANGCFDVVFESGATPTALTITPQTGMVMEWINGFVSTVLSANMLYELNIKIVGNRCLGVAVPWAWQT